MGLETRLPCPSHPGLHQLSNHSFFFGSSKQQLGHLRTIPDPEFPGEDEHLFFVMVELNLDDVKELKRVTALEMQGTLDAEGVKAFVEALQLIWLYIYIFPLFSKQIMVGYDKFVSKRSKHPHGVQHGFFGGLNVHSPKWVSKHLYTFKGVPNIFIYIQRVSKHPHS